MMKEWVQQELSSNPYYQRYHGADHIFLHTGDQKEFTDKSWRIGCRPLQFQMKPKEAQTLFRSQLFCPSRIVPSPYPVQVVLQSQPQYSTVPILERKILFHFRGQLDRRDDGLRKRMAQLCEDYPASTWKQGSCQIVNVDQAVQQKHAFQDIPSNFEIFAQESLASRFCLVPRGDDPSTPHLVDAIAAGCIPIIISDFMELPFSRYINWGAFSLRVSEKAVKNSPVQALYTNLVALISDEKLHQMQQALFQARKYVLLLEGQFSTQSSPRLLLAWRNRTPCVMRIRQLARTL